MSETLLKRPSPEMVDAMRRRGMAERVLTVQSSTRVTPNMQRVVVTQEGEGAFDLKPGQDLVLMLPDQEGGLGRRHYTVRRYDAATGCIDLDVVLHGDDNPGPRWALNARAGDQVVCFGPRGHIHLRSGAEWRVFFGDETCLPAILAMIEALPEGAPATAYIEIEAEADAQAVETQGDVRVEWLVRAGPAQPMSRLLNAEVAAFQPPAGQGHIYLIGETSSVRWQRQSLIARGVPADQIIAEGFWRPGRLGGHDHVRD
ncbi:siderophore-interacting protein [Phenylobacterium immobile]|uniref:siderophore-interacting protein n=1 Tax=Phenylobacterium immobile TaxID=21 RepID=UPI000A3FB635|nr:siderophore-interacting protein [Phenylobacterium immobile]